MLGYMAENLRTGACDVVEYDELATLTGAGWTPARRSHHVRGTCSRERSPASANTPRSTGSARKLDGAPRAHSSSTARLASEGTRDGASSTNSESRLETFDGGYRTWLAAEAARAQEPLRLVNHAL